MPTSSSTRLSHGKLSLSEFRTLCSQTSTPESYPLATDIVHNIPVYSGPDVLASSVDVRSSFQDEWYRGLLSGPGVFVLRKMYPSSDLLDRVSNVYSSIIASEEANGLGGDHFAASGQNKRIWNSFEKHAVTDAKSFYEYYSNPLLALVSEAWLGPAYRVTAQVNIVAPGSEAQVAHRDYHLGFQTAKETARYPLAMQVASQLLTLQGAVAHTDMPIESGPTKVLPFSQTFEKGYLAYRDQEFRDFFEENFVQAPLEKGDAVFFSPALFHAAGANRTTDIRRSANLLQISSAFGKPMEAVNTTRIALHTWDVLTERAGSRNYGLSSSDDIPEEIECFVKAIAEGYSFPINLDRVPPRNDGMAPESEQEVVLRALKNGWDRDRLEQELAIRKRLASTV